jgi:hypothetical protein
MPLRKGWGAGLALETVIPRRETVPQPGPAATIIPLVLYHGPERAWTAPRRVEELFDVPQEERELWLAVLPSSGTGWTT